MLWFILLACWTFPAHAQTYVTQEYVTAMAHRYSTVSDELPTLDCTPGNHSLEWRRSALLKNLFFVSIYPEFVGVLEKGDTLANITFAALGLSALWERQIAAEHKVLAPYYCDSKPYRGDEFYAAATSALGDTFFVYFMMQETSFERMWWVGNEQEIVFDVLSADKWYQYRGGASCNPVWTVVDSCNITVLPQGVWTTLAMDTPDLAKQQPRAAFDEMAQSGRAIWAQMQSRDILTEAQQIVQEVLKLFPNHTDPTSLLKLNTIKSKNRLESGLWDDADRFNGAATDQPNGTPAGQSLTACRDMMLGDAGMIHAIKSGVFPATLLAKFKTFIEDGLRSHD